MSKEGNEFSKVSQKYFFIAHLDDLCIYHRLCLDHPTERWVEQCTTKILIVIKRMLHPPAQLPHGVQMLLVVSIVGLRNKSSGLTKMGKSCLCLCLCFPQEKVLRFD